MAATVTGSRFQASSPHAKARRAARTAVAVRAGAVTPHAHTRQTIESDTERDSPRALTARCPDLLIIERSRRFA
jgi:hypothetical protein